MYISALECIGILLTNHGVLFVDLSEVDNMLFICHCTFRVRLDFHRAAILATECCDSAEHFCADVCQSFNNAEDGCSNLAPPLTVLKAGAYHGFINVLEKIFDEKLMIGGLIAIAVWAVSAELNILAVSDNAVDCLDLLTELDCGCILCDVIAADALKEIGARAAAAWDISRRTGWAAVSVPPLEVVGIVDVARCDDTEGGPAEGSVAGGAPHLITAAVMEDELATLGAGLGILGEHCDEFEGLLGAGVGDIAIMAFRCVAFGAGVVVADAALPCTGQHAAATFDCALADELAALYSLLLGSVENAIGRWEFTSTERSYIIINTSECAIYFGLSR